MQPNKAPSDPMQQKLESLFDMIENGEELSDENNSPLVQQLKESKQRYSQTSTIARGGMKTVSKTFDNKTGRFVAMAKLHANTPRELYEAFLREARLTALLDHPNIISIFEIDLDENSAPYFTMELKTGQGLNELIKELYSTGKALKAAELNRLLEIFLKICDGIAYAHAQKVLHLDLKPENIQVGIYGEVIICDWGLGKVIGDPNYDGGEFDRMLLNPDLLNNMTLADEVRGTPGFMAPEQIDGKICVTLQSDIYTLGALLYSILTGCPPIDLDNSLEDILQQTSKGTIIPPQQRFPHYHLPASLSAVAMKALQTRPHKRYQTVEALRDDVYNFISGYSTSAEEAHFFTEFHLFFKRNRSICLIIFLCLALLSSLTVFFVNGLRDSMQEAERSRSKAEASQIKAEENQQLAITEKERAERLLTLYKAEQKNLTLFIKKNFAALKEEVYNLTDIHIYHNPIKVCNRVLANLEKMTQSQPSALWPYMQRGYVYFLMQDLTKANKNFQQHHKQAKQIYQLSKKFAPHSRPGELLHIKHLTELLQGLNKLRHKNVVIVIMMLYDAKVRNSLYDHSQAVEVTLQAYNGRWKEAVFQFNQDKFSLKISGQGLTRVSVLGRHLNVKNKPHDIRIPLLQTLKLKSLDLRGTGIEDIAELGGLNIEKLDIRQTPIKDCSNIRKLLPKLKKLIISPAQLKTNDPLYSQASIQIIEN